MLEVKRKLKPFTVPNFVIEDTQETPTRSYPLSEVDEQVLIEMCNQFRSDVFAKAGIPDPCEARTVYREMAAQW